MANIDLEYIMNNVQDHGKDYFTKNQNNGKLIAVFREQTKLILDYISSDKKKCKMNLTKN